MREFDGKMDRNTNPDPVIKKNKSGQTNQVILQTARITNATAPITPTPIITSASIMPTQFVPPTQSGTTNDGHNIQYVTVPVDQLPFLSFNEFEAGGSVHRGPAGGTFRERGRCGRGSRQFIRNQGEFDAYSMDVAPINIFENQVIPVGLHNLSRSFKPNLTTTRVFSLGTKCIE